MIRRRLARYASDRGAELIEMAIVLPILLFIFAGIIDFGFMFQRYEVLTNAAREGARIAVLPGTGPEAAEDAIVNYMQNGHLTNYASASIDVEQNGSILVDGANISASEITIQYPFDFIVLGPVARLVNPDTSLGGDFMMVVTAVMRNEAGG